MYATGFPREDPCDIFDKTIDTMRSSGRLYIIFGTMIVTTTPVRPRCKWTVCDPVVCLHTWHTQAHKDAQGKTKVSQNSSQKAHTFTGDLCKRALHSPDQSRLPGLSHYEKRDVFCNTGRNPHDTKAKVAIISRRTDTLSNFQQLPHSTNMTGCFHDGMMNSAPGRNWSTFQALGPARTEILITIASSWHGLVPSGPLATCWNEEYSPEALSTETKWRLRRQVNVTN